MNEEKIKNLIKESNTATIVAATKYTTKEGIRKLISLGITNVGENRVDDFLEKYDPNLKVKWHFIGHLQRNKVKKIINKIDFLESLDSLELASLINEERLAPLDCFIEVKLTSNENKSGILESNLNNFLEQVKEYKNINIVGIMTMTDKSMDDTQKEAVFKSALSLKEKYNLKELSMGMSNDYKLALKNHASFIRLGRILYEKEDYNEKYINYYEEK